MVIVGAMGLALVLLGVFVWAPFQAHIGAGVDLNGVELSISYEGGTPAFLGPAHQDTCQQQDPANSLLQCPTRLSDGLGYDLTILNFLIPENASRAFFNFSVSAPLPFYQQVGRTGDMTQSPIGNSSTVSFVDLGGAYCLWIVAIGIPDQPPPLPNGFDLTANLTVHLA